MPSTALRLFALGARQEKLTLFNQLGPIQEARPRPRGRTRHNGSGPGHAHVPAHWKDMQEPNMHIVKHVAAGSAIGAGAGALVGPGIYAKRVASGVPGMGAKGRAIKGAFKAGGFKRPALIGATIGAIAGNAVGAIKAVGGEEGRRIDEQFKRDNPRHNFPRNLLNNHH